MQEDKFAKFIAVRRVLRDTERKHQGCPHLETLHHMLEELLVEHGPSLGMTKDQVTLLGGGTNKDQ